MVLLRLRPGENPTARYVDLTSQSEVPKICLFHKIIFPYEMEKKVNDVPPKYMEFQSLKRQ